MNPRTLLAVAAVVCPLPLARAAPALADTVRLEDLEARAVRDRPALEASHARIRQARAGIDRAESGGYPTLSLNFEGTLAPGGQLVEVEDLGSPSREHFQVQGARTLSDGWEAFAPVPRYGVTLGIQGTLYDFGRSTEAEHAARALRGAARAEERATREQIIRTVRAAYMTWTAAHELHGVALQNVADAHARRARVESLIEEGARPQSDLAPARADEALSRLEAARADGDRERARLQLEQAVGGRLPGTAEPDPSILTRTIEGPRERTDPSLTALARQREAARAKVRAFDHRHAPVLAAGAQLGVRGQSVSFFPNYGATVSLSVPLWDGGAGAAGADEARAQSAELSARAAELRAARRTEQAVATADQTRAQERITISTELLEAAQMRLQQAEERYDLGAGSIEAVAEARAGVRRARSELVLARVARAEAALRLAGLRSAR